uniref:C2H2-type domain-containing protein n=1 Tax=Pectinophora gossypiella TaxID=13191 RepID=A0A1E1WK97_PECGO
MDVSKLCRSCMEEVAPWECENVDQKTMEMFSFCTNIEIPVDDNLPRHFCYKCTVLLESTYTYIKKARRVNGKLKRIIQKSTNNFVDKFLNKTNSVEAEKPDENVLLNNFIEPEKINDETNDVKVNLNNVDHDIFDDDDEDDKCLSEFKSENVDIKLEPEEDSSSTVVSKEAALQVSESDDKNKNNGHSSKMKFKSKKCQICKKNFASKGWYSRHMKTAHAGDTSKELGELKKKKSHKKQRETKETGDQKGEIKCRVCDKVFSSKAWRTKHLNEQHSESVDGQKVFLCPYCPKSKLT